VNFTVAWSDGFSAKITVLQPVWPCADCLKRTSRTLFIVNTDLYYEESDGVRRFFFKALSTWDMHLERWLWTAILWQKMSIPAIFGWDGFFWMRRLFFSETAIFFIRLLFYVTNILHIKKCLRDVIKPLMFKLWRELKPYHSYISVSFPMLVYICVEMDIGGTKKHEKAWQLAPVQVVFSSDFVNCTGARCFLKNPARGQDFSCSPTNKTHRSHTPDVPHCLSHPLLPFPVQQTH
jgi:hypothetical protein